MPYTFDVEADGVRCWELTEDGAEATVDDAYEPSIYVGVRDGDREKLQALAATLVDDPKVQRIGLERWFTSLRDDEREPLLRLDLERPTEVDALAHEIRTLHEFGEYAPGAFELYNVDFSPEFRYCLETGTDPTPARELTTLDVRLPEHALASGDLSQLAIDGEAIGGTDRQVLDALDAVLQEHDPDVLLLSTARLVPYLTDRAHELGFKTFTVGRREGYTQLAGESEMITYGRVMHSPARYSVPGRALIDRSNSFMLSKSGIPGIVDLVERSHKPLQEAGWASIGNLLTAIQIRQALERDVLIPWNKFQHEAWKTVRDLHQADRGGFTFQPDVGLHEDVHELDFSSLYPNIMIEHNISPETVLCDCHPEREDVPLLGYNLCPERGFLADVLEPIVEDRDAIKQAIRESDDAEEIERLEAKSDALKWILVTCFGYQGYKNSKFGRIEAHEAINAYARDILVQSKKIFEREGWRVIHGIVDSIWVEADAEAPTDLETVAAGISEEVGIRLEYENAFDWLCLVPKAESGAGALTKYFGKKRGEDGYKVRGVEIRQRSTPDFVARAQRDFMDTLDRHREAEPVLDVCQRRLQELRSGRVDPQALAIRKRVSKALEAYSQSTQTVAALERYQVYDVEKAPGEDVQYVVVDDGARQGAQRVRLPFEEPEDYDAEFYATLTIRACEAVVSPLGWDRNDIRRYLRDMVDVGLIAFK